MTILCKIGRASLRVRLNDRSLSDHSLLGRSGSLAMSLNYEVSSSKVLDSTLDALATAGQSVELSVVMPCLNEHETVGICVRKAMSRLLREAGIAGEVIVADNGSTDGSRRARAGRRRPVVRHIEQRGTATLSRAGSRPPVASTC